LTKYPNTEPKEVFCLFLPLHELQLLDGFYLVKQKEQLIAMSHNSIKIKKIKKLFLKADFNVHESSVCRNYKIIQNPN